MSIRLGRCGISRSAWQSAALALAFALAQQAGQAATVYHCVTDSAGLASVLAATSADGNLDFVLLAAGTYETPVGGFSATVQGANDALVIAGGFDVDGGDCVAPARSDARRTTLNGLDTNPGLTIIGGQNGNLIAVQNLTIAHAHRDQAANERGGGLAIDVSSDFGGGILVERVIFSHDLASGPGGALSVSTGTQTGFTTIRNNLFFANYALIGAAIAVSGSASEKDLIGNTIVGNQATTAISGAEAAVYRSSENWKISNNIIYSNVAADQVDMKVKSFDTYADNDIQYLSGTPTLQAGTAAYSVDPGFVGIANFRLRTDSPLADAGLTSATGSVGSYDLDGLARVVGGKIDVGAYGHDAMLITGFESD